MIQNICDQIFITNLQYYCMVSTARERISLNDSNNLVESHINYLSEVDKIVEENNVIREELNYNKLMFSFFNYEHDLLEAMRNEH